MTKGSQAQISEFQLNEFTMSMQWLPTITGLADGGFVVTWQSSQLYNSGYAVKARIFNADDTSRVGEFLVNELTYRSQNFPDITSLEDGGYIISWTSSDSQEDEFSARDIIGRIFNADGTERLSNFLIHKNTLNGQNDLNIIELNNGSFKSTLKTYSSKKDGDSFPIKEHIFSADSTEQVLEFIANEYMSLNQALVEITTFLNSIEHHADGTNENATLAIKGADKLADTDGDYDIIYGGDGDDHIFSHYGNYEIYGGYGNDEIHGGYGNDRIYGGYGNDLIYGGYGNNEISGGDGNDEIHGGDGNDLISGGYGNDLIYGDDGDDHISSHYGNNEIYGGDGDDHISVGDGNDEIYGGDGNDEIYGGDGDDEIYGGDGNDEIYGGLGNDVIIWSEGQDEIYGGGGEDIFDMSAHSYADFTITDDTFLQVENTENGTSDLLQDVEYIQFAEGVYNVEAQNFIAGDDLLG